jgi:predicted flap endonuclease-1-like 5' DNA nuclease
MMQTIEANWVVFAVALVAALLVAWWLFGRATSVPRRREHKPDVLDQGVGPAQRNQALIDAPPAAQIPPAITPPAFGGAMGGIAEAVAIGAQDVVEEAEAKTRAAPEPAPKPAPEPEPAPPPAAPAPQAKAPTKPKAGPKPKPAAKAAPKAKPEPKAKAASKAEPKPKATPKPKAEPKAAPAPEPVAAIAPPPPPPPPSPAPEPVTIAADDLGRIKGLGPKLQALLPTLGLSTFAQIAALSEADLAELDPKLGPFAGRPARDSWVEQARFLAAGDVAGFEARFGKV